MATYVLVHGGWDGGWAWRGVARELQAAGHEVFRPTLTGSGERVHLASRDVDLETHVQDIVDLLRYEDLHDVILVGISYAGMVITGVAERTPERIGHLIYLDAWVPEDGQSLLDLIGPEVAAGFAQAAQAYGDGWRLPHDPPDADRRTDFLLKVLQQPLRIANPDAVRLKRTFVLFSTGTPTGSWGWLAALMQRTAARVRQEGWNVREMPFDHWPVLDRPREVAQLLLELG